ncbi:MAG TPA: SUMF1/EgtB/PvdO family nonheme iron enzyme [Anaerolineaceae bacterium]|nr:SUMF1/EgtB/PvdO family nonheme iron enzyme [Anaerolineaceae bacterium]
MKTALLVTVCALLLLSACQTGPMPPNPAYPDLQVPTEVPAANQESPTSVPGSDPTDMVVIPAGAFWLGCDPAHNDSLGCTEDELPSQSVELPEFKIDIFEVTNAKYAKCVQAGACTAPSSLSSETRENYFDNPEFADYPVIFVSWKQADAYCTWAGKRLPTEAEWEKATGWGDSKLAFPWGDHTPTCDVTNARLDADLKNCTGDTQPVGHYPSGAGIWEVMDMTGNVWEWTANRYLPDYRPGAPEETLTGAPSDLYRVVRGGGWDSAPANLLISSRSFDPEFHSSNNLGFRCAAD